MNIETSLFANVKILDANANVYKKNSSPKCFFKKTTSTTIFFC